MKNAMMGAVVVSAMFAGAAGATTVNVEWQHGDIFGPHKLQRRAQVDGPGFTGPTLAGMFQLQGDNGVGAFVGFCIDLAQRMKRTASYVVKPDLFDAPVLTNINKLFSNAYADVDTATEAAGFQLALWEVVYDSENTGYNLASGDFSVGQMDDQVETAANDFLGRMSDPNSGGYDLTFLSSDEAQDLVYVSQPDSSGNTPTAVPLPGAGLMLLTGLGLAGVASRRRKA